MKRHHCLLEEEEKTDEDTDQIVKTIGNKIYFYAEVNKENVFKLIEALHHTTKGSLGLYNEVRLFINSNGGDAYAGLSAMDHIAKNPIPVTTVADGLVASAATFLLLAGQKRIALSNSFILVHQLSTGFWGKYCDLVDELKNSKCLMNKIKEIYSEKTDVSSKRLDDMLSKELIIDSKRARELGFVTTIE